MSTSLSNRGKVSNRDPITREKLQNARSINHSQVKLYAVAHSIVFERKLVLKGSLPLSLKQDLMRLTTDARGHLGFEQAWASRKS